MYFIMAFTAIAGGTGHVGKTILDVLGEDPEHKTIVLSRTVSLAVISNEILEKRLTRTQEKKKVENQPEIIAMD